MIEEVCIVSETDSEIIFASKSDLRKFWDEVSNGKVILLTMRKGGVETSRMLNPINSPDINDGRVILRSEEKVEPNQTRGAK